MKNLQPMRSYSRGVRAAALVAVIGIWQSVSGNLNAAPAAAVVSVQSTRVTDLVLLNNGFNAGLRQGMVCRISRGTTEVAEVLLVELRPTCSAALILSVAPKQAIRAGDVASIKVLKS